VGREFELTVLSLTIEVFRGVVICLVVVVSGDCTVMGGFISADERKHDSPTKWPQKMPSPTPHAVPSVIWRLPGLPRRSMSFLGQVANIDHEAMSGNRYVVNKAVVYRSQAHDNTLPSTNIALFV
jgi:hypothetical protein